ncbi:Polysaccharide biosynthesis protein [Xanthomarina gelatinilytica]|uniref:Polysaccharide biosynthesis protein n=1 Tax=Xanthomarina gelatinilytica TaxID=1137281 RepID=M7MD71_9FLAO|nr:polysaccharide biosynthesis C-terminal domain-containing protein [Xanthomarina gelatinilytica]EMQ94107.1 Polysaccharide biosynthesis protein [Xanthomarina gelatinilytica]
MGVVVNQSIKNTIVTYLGFGIGAINVLFLYTSFLSDEYFGLVSYLLSTANIMMPLMAFGVHNTIVKFYSSFKTKQSQNSFLTLMLFLPLLVIIPFGLIGHFAFSYISSWLAADNKIVVDYVWLIYIAAITFAYFEVFYAWSKVQMQTVFGNFMKEVFHRLCTTLLLLMLHAGYLSVNQFIYSVVGVYALRMLIMKLYAFSLRLPKLKFERIPNVSRILKYTTLIIVAGSVANVILEIDKFMINRYEAIENVAYYGVAIYIATVIGVPYRSMYQIVNPLTAKLLNEKNKIDLKILYQKSSLTLFIISGFIFLMIILNINELYKLINESYVDGLIVVFIIGLTKLSDSLLGNNNAILFNSDYYRMVLVLGVFLAVLTIVLNMVFIPLYGINGAAFATFIAILIYNISKILFVYYKFKILPFSANTIKVVLLLLVCLGVFYFWDFKFHPVLNIALKSLLISMFYGFVVYALHLSDDISILLNKIFRKNKHTS